MAQSQIGRLLKGLTERWIALDRNDELVARVIRELYADPWLESVGFKVGPMLESWDAAILRVKGIRINGHGGNGNGNGKSRAAQAAEQRAAERKAGWARAFERVGIRLSDSGG